MVSDFTRLSVSSFSGVVATSASESESKVRVATTVVLLTSQSPLGLDADLGQEMRRASEFTRLSNSLGSEEDVLN